MIKSLSISGFRGFGQEQTISFANPDGVTIGSGLTVITGSNNSGKTTIIESIRAFDNSSSPSFSEGKRNSLCDGKITLKLLETGSGQEEEYIIKSLDGGGSSTKKNKDFPLQYNVVQSRRAVDFEFHDSPLSRERYINNACGLQSNRVSYMSYFNGRIFDIEKNNKTEFNKIVNKVMGDKFQWTIEQRDNGSYYIKYTKNGISHSSEGLGDGVWSIFTICALLFDAPINSTLLIDEPELSIHPSLQKNLLKLFLDYSKERQIIICTHSPYFINWKAISKGAQFIRVVKEDVNSICYSISNESQANIMTLLNDLNNPHTLGLEANEIFFLEDNIILVEGQEDVIIFNKISEDIAKPIIGNFYGWGAGGAHKIRIFMKLFQDLGYKKVLAIFDGDKVEEAKNIEQAFPDFKIIILKKNDIRDKKERNIPKKEGLTTNSGKLKDENKEYAIELIDEINDFFE